MLFQENSGYINVCNNIPALHSDEIDELNEMHEGSDKRKSDAINRL